MTEVFNYICKAAAYFWSFLALPLGVSIYASVVVSRRFAYHAEINRAREAVLTIVDRFWAVAESDSDPDGDQRFVWIVFPPGQALVHLGHRRAANICGEISQHFAHELPRLTLRYREQRDSDRRTIPPGFYGAELAKMIERAFKRLSAAQPDFRAIWLIPKRVKIDLGYDQEAGD